MPICHDIYDTCTVAKLLPQVTHPRTDHSCLTCMIMTHEGDCCITRKASSITSV